ncbi:MAG: SRPBCC family protein [Candidatus Sericytochromatia bacterium]
MPHEPLRLTCQLQASPERVYRALTTAEDVAHWMVPDGMTSQVHVFEPHVGGAFRITLRYADPSGMGKTDAHSDTYHGRFVTLVPHEQVVETMAFESDDPAMQGTMTVHFGLRAHAGGTELTAVHEGLPEGVSPSDNALGWQLSFEKLARLVSPLLH